MKKMITKWMPFIVVTVVGMAVWAEVAPYYVALRNNFKKNQMEA